MPSPRSFLVALALTAGTIGLAACGGSSDEGDEGGSGGSADAICADAAREQLELASESRGATAPEQVAGYMADLAASGRAALDGLAELSPPEGSSDDWQAYLDNREESIAVIAEREAAAREGDDEEMARTAEQLSKLLEERDEIGARLGLGACARELPDEDRAEIEETIELVTTSPDGELVCGELVAPELIEQRFGGDVEECARVQSGARQADSVRIGDLLGVEGVLATAEVELEGPRRVAGPAEVELHYDAGSDAWRVFRLTPRDSG